MDLEARKLVLLKNLEERGVTMSLEEETTFLIEQWKDVEGRKGRAAVVLQELLDLVQEVVHGDYYTVEQWDERQDEWDEFYISRDSVDDDYISRDSVDDDYISRDIVDDEYVHEDVVNDDYISRDSVSDFYYHSDEWDEREAEYNNELEEKDSELNAALEEARKWEEQYDEAEEQVMAWQAHCSEVARRTGYECRTCGHYGCCPRCQVFNWGE